MPQKSSADDDMPSTLFSPPSIMAINRYLQFVTNARVVGKPLKALCVINDFLV